MKRITLILIFTLPTLLFAQSTDKQIAAIKTQTQQIENNLSTFQRTDTNNSKGYKYVYIKNKKLQLIAVCDKGTPGIDKNVKWYFANGAMIYVFQVWTNNKTGDTIDIEKFYLANTHLIYWTKLGKPIDNNTDEFKSIATQLEAYGEKLETIYTGK